MRYLDRDAAKAARRRGPAGKPRLIVVDLVVLTRLSHECTILRGKVREEVSFRGVILGEQSAEYRVRYIGTGQIDEARRLRQGQRIVRAKGQFSIRHGRDESEFHIFEFTSFTPQLPQGDFGTESNPHTPGV